MIGNQVEPLPHLQIRVVRRVVGSWQCIAGKRARADCGQVVCMDVVRVDIVRIAQHRRAGAQAYKREAIRGVDARRAKNGQRHAVALAPYCKLRLCIRPAHGARTLRMDLARFIDQGTCTIAIDAAGADIDEAGW